MAKSRGNRDDGFKEELCREVASDLGISPKLVQGVVDSLFKEVNNQVMRTSPESDRSLIIKVPYLGSIMTVAPLRHKKIAKARAIALQKIENNQKKEQ